MKKSLGARTLLYPTPVLVVGTYDSNGKPNVMVASWAGICCSMPPCVAVSLRKATYTYGNILDRKAFTLGIPSEQHLKEVDYCGLVSGRNVDKCGETGLTPIRAELVDAPYIQEFPVILECKLFRTVELGLHTQFVGEIQDVKVESENVDENGVTDLARIRPLVFQPDAQTYFGIGAPLGPAFSVGEELGRG